MIYAGYLIAAFLVLQFCIALINLLFRQQPGSSSRRSNALISILIPARDEEQHIGKLLNELLHQTYDHLEILVYDDLSTDRTPEVVNRIAARDARVRLIAGDALPEGWLGKNRACDALSQEAKGEWLLFLDADVSISEHFIGKIIDVAATGKTNLVSVFPRQQMKGLGEWITIPLMNFILLTLLPLVLVRKSGFTSLSAANGQCMLFDAATYHTLRPHARMRLNRVEDIAIARYYKKSGRKVACIASMKEISCRMYHGYRQSLQGFSKNVIAFFGNSYILATLFWLLITFGWINLWHVFPPFQFGVFLVMMAMTRVFVALASGQSVLFNLVLIIPQYINLGVLIGLSIYNHLTKRFTWKGRNIS
jgi:hypothetical protein